jgi:hypothetical protein
MNYSLRREDTDLGTASLDDLRRRRGSGELTGGEYVKGPTDSHWRLLEDVLQLERTGAAPPLLDPPVLGPSTSKLPIALALAFAVVLLAAGAYFAHTRSPQLAVPAPPAETPYQLASRPIKPANTLTEKDVEARVRLFKRRQWLEGYDVRGIHDGPPDRATEEFIDVFIDKAEDGPKSASPLELDKESERLAHDPSCKDPAVLTLAASNTLNWYDRVGLYKRAIAAFPASRHLAYPALYAELNLMSESKYDYGEEGELDTTALAHLARCFADGSIQPGDQQEFAEVFVDGWGSNFFRKNDAAVCKIAYEAGPSYHWLALVLDGYRDITDAWAARGDGYSNTVSEEQKANYIRLLTEARKPLQEAWLLQPDYPMAPNLMVYDSLGSGLTDMRTWFDRTVAAQIDYPGAWSNLRWGLQPRWYGNGPAEIALGKVALATGRFDTDVPRKLFDCATDVESWTELPDGQRIFGRSDIWPSLQKMYEGYIAEPTQAAFIRGWRTSYAVVAYFSGHYDVARKQLEAIDWKLAPASLNSWGVDLSSMPLEVAARTGPLAVEVGAAESARSSGKRAAALRMFADLDAKHTGDARSAEFIRLRLSRLTDEQHLFEGKWVTLLPTSDEDSNWVYSFGKAHRNADGSLDVEYGRKGHMLFAKMPVGGNFEVRGSYEVVRSSDTNFQGGIVIGQPDIDTYKWFGFRLKRHDVEGDVVTFSLGWSLREMTQPVTLSDKSNSFDLVLRDGRVTASVNGERVFENADTPAYIDTPQDSYVVGLGAFSDSASAVVRYRGVEIRTLGESDLGLPSPPTPTPVPPADSERKKLPLAEQVAADKAEMGHAIESVKAIVNQPALSVPITENMNVTHWSDTWFHPGAIVPEYGKVDVTKTQQLSYSQYEYVTSKLHPEIAFLGSDLEFNPMTKYFYTDLTVPKKRLTQSEMLEVNRLYRVIAKCKEDLARLQAQ